MYIAWARPAIVLMSEMFVPITWNSEAIRVLDYARRKGAYDSFATSFTEEMMYRLRPHMQTSSAPPITQIESGRRKYLCRTMPFDAKGHDGDHFQLVILTRPYFSELALQQSEVACHLTGREMQIARLLVPGLTNKQVASRLNISENTVKVFLHSIMMKLGVTTRSAVVGQMVSFQPHGLASRP